MDAVCPAVRLTPGTTPVRWHQLEWDVPAVEMVAIHRPTGACFFIRLLANAEAMAQGFDVLATIYDVEARLVSCGTEIPDLGGVEAWSRRAILAFISERAMWWPGSDWVDGEPRYTMLRKPGSLLVKLSRFAQGEDLR